MRTPTTRRRRVITAVLGILALPVIFALMIVWHECGHTVAAWVVGDLSARFEFIDLDYPCVGCNLYDSAELPPAANAFVNIAGPLATQVLAWTAVILLIVRRWGSLTTWLLADVLIVTLADVVWQCVQPFLPGAEVTAPLGDGVTYVDGSAIVVFVNQAAGIAPPVIVVSLLAIVAVHLTAIAVVLIAGVRRRRARRDPDVSSMWSQEDAERRFQSRITS